MTTNLVHTTEASHFDLVCRQADMFAKSDIIPSAYRRKPADIIAAAMAGGAYGWDAMTSLRQFHVIEGSASMKPEAMLGLVRMAGHSVTVVNEPDAAVAKGKRCDTGDEHTATFTMKDAAAAGLAGKRNWKQYPDAMLTWRAVAALCRVLFPDVVLGAGYVPEEFGVEVNENGEPTGEPFIAVDGLFLDSDGVATIRGQLDELDGFLKDDLRDWWLAEGIPGLDSGDITRAQGDTIGAKIVDLSGGLIEEAELVEVAAE